ncbi:hypothetical protein [Aquimarina litoralis]|uniref:hypothetical protein n=1 Tax=Aquimarina litoralis TaxID=584605 RepID=UPI001C59F2E7|nr:hypothetical protein [Aquimarina litoralis]MBW1298417.1 hypothetical protein [Aquimarina litoralis]
MEIQECNLNIRYDLPKEVFDKLEHVFSKMPGWLGYGTKSKGDKGSPYWFSYDENEKYITAFLRSGGLQFEANMQTDEWISWKTQFKKVATEILRFKVGEIAKGEVGHKIEWID